MRAFENMLCRGSNIRRESDRVIPALMHWTMEGWRGWREGINTTDELMQSDEALVALGLRALGVPHWLAQRVWFAH